jgi:LPS sulfotransferase NodH
VARLKPSADRSETDQAAAQARRLLDREDRVAWILGSSRSGSTWLLQMLTDIEGIAGVDDPHLGHHLGVWRPLPLAWATAQTRPELRTLTEVKREKPDYFFSDRYRDAWLPALRELIAARFGAQLADAGGGPDSVLVVKEPGSHAADLLLDALPGSRLIFLLRDGRDVVDSWIDAYQRDSWAIEEGAYAVAREGRLALVEWLSSVWAYRTRAVADVFERIPAERRVRIRYEDLLADPAGELGRACAALGVEADPERIAQVAAAHSISQVAPEERGPLREVRNAEPGGWRSNLEPAEQRAMHELMGAELERFGYPVARPPAVAA